MSYSHLCADDVSLGGVHNMEKNVTILENINVLYFNVLMKYHIPIDVYERYFYSRTIIYVS